MNAMAITYPAAAKEINRRWPRQSSEPEPWRDEWADPETLDGGRLDDMDFQMKACDGCHGLADCTHHDIHREGYQGDSTLNVGERQLWRPKIISSMTHGRYIDETWELSVDDKTAYRTVLLPIPSQCKYARSANDYKRGEATAEISHIPKVYRSVTLDSFEVVRGSQHIVVAAEKYINDRQYMDGRWLFIGGTLGAGKTHIAAAIANAARDAGHHVAFFKAAGLLGQGRTEGNEFGKAAWDSAASSDLAVIDDIGREFLGKGENSWQSQRMDQLIDTIYTNNRGLIFTGNLSPEEFTALVKAHYSDRAQSRMLERTAMLEMAFPDYRRRLKEARDV